MGQAKWPICAWCELEPKPLIYPKQDLVQRTVYGVLVWLHTQCEFAYRTYKAERR